MSENSQIEQGVNKILFEHVSSILKSKKLSFKEIQDLGVVAIGLKGKSYEFNAFFICGKQSLTFSIRLPVLLDENNYKEALVIANKYSIQSPLGCVEILREQGPVAVKFSFPVAGEVLPTDEVVEMMMVKALQLAENCAPDFFDLVKSPSNEN